MDVDAEKYASSTSRHILPPVRFNNLVGFLNKIRSLRVSVMIDTTATCAFYMAYNSSGLQFGTYLAKSSGGILFGVHLCLWHRCKHATVEIYN